jgi:hypothetical protein
MEIPTKFRHGSDEKQTKEELAFVAFYRIVPRGSAVRNMGEATMTVGLVV